jgi:acyl-homoserine lactone acylase PvdQ
MAVLELEDQELRMQAVNGEISIKRDEYGTPVIVAGDFQDALYGLGLVQAHDRGMQMELTRLLARGQLSEYLPPNENLTAMDITMRKYDIWGFSRKQALLLEEALSEEMEAFCRGVNDQFQENPPAEPLEKRHCERKRSPWKNVIATVNEALGKTSLRAQAKQPQGARFSLSEPAWIYDQLLAIHVLVFSQV